MGLKLNRNKKRHYLLTLIYRFDKLILLKNKFKLKLYLDLEWIFSRLALEYSFKVFPYESHPNRVFSKDFMFQQINENERVLDLGCKYGDVTKLIGNKAQYVLGIDYDENAIKIAKNNYEDVENIDFVVAEAYEYLEKNNDPFDVLILSHILEHLDNPSDFLKKFSSFFKKIYIEVPDFDASYMNHYRKKIKASLNYTDGDHVFEFDREELLELINSCNLVVDVAEFRYGVQKIWCSHIK